MPVGGIGPYISMTAVAHSGLKARRGGDLMKLNRLTYLLTFAALICLFANCDDDMQKSDDAVVVESDDVMTSTLVTQNQISFFIHNTSHPHSKKLTIKLTMPIGSGGGSGMLTGLGLFDDNPFFEMFDLPCSGVSCTYTTTLFGCQNYGTIEVYVSYTGMGKPRLTYQFTNC